QPHRPGLGVLVVPDRHRAILPSKEGAHKTRDGSESGFGCGVGVVDCVGAQVGQFDGFEVAHTISMGLRSWA
uniref:hypothetical protein n=1 Tax=Mycobacterium ostraviense TaxID=2738409 RepID=UPI00195CA1B0